MFLVMLREGDDLVGGEAAPVAVDGLRDVEVKDPHVGHQFYAADVPLVADGAGEAGHLLRAEALVVLEQPLGDEILAAGLAVEGLADGGAFQLGNHEASTVDQRHRAGSNTTAVAGELKVRKHSVLGPCLESVG